MPYRPPLYGIFWGHIFCKYGGWGWSELFSTVSRKLPTVSQKAASDFFTFFGSLTMLSKGKGPRRKFTVRAELMISDGTKVTESTQNADFRRKPQIFADSPLLLEIPAFWRAQETAENRRFSQKTEDFRRKPQETADWALSP